MKNSNQKKEDYKSNEIVNGEIKTILNKKNPNYFNIDKKRIKKKFINDITKNKKIREKAYKTIDKFNKLVIIEINKKEYWFSIDFVDSGGKQSDKKISIPFSGKEFRKLIDEHKSVYVVNIYETLQKQKWKREYKRDDKYVWLIVGPKEIYNSKCIDTKNDSSRWTNVEDIAKIINTNEIAKNSNKNVTIVPPAKIKDFLKNNLIEDDSENIKESLRTTIRGLLSKPTKKGRKSSKKKEIEEKTIRKIRTKFRDLLLSERINCEITNVHNKKLLIASHIWPIKEIKNDKKLSINKKMEYIADPANGLLLEAGFDKLFDKSLITFDNEWKLIISKELNKHEVEHYNLKKFQQDKMFKNKDNSLFYLEKNREIFNNEKREKD